MSDKLRCAWCGDEIAPPSAETEREYRENFPHSAASDAPRTSVCTDCYDAIQREMPSHEWENQEYRAS